MPRLCVAETIRSRDREPRFAHACSDFVHARTVRINYDTDVGKVGHDSISETFEKIRVIDLLGGIMCSKVPQSPQT